MAYSTYYQFKNDTRQKYTDNQSNIPAKRAYHIASTASYFRRKIIW